MPALSDDKNEQFAMYVASGLSKREAAVKAGYSPKTASSQGSQLASRPKIANRIAELKGLASEKVVEATVKGHITAIHDRLQRVADLQEQRDKIKQIILERANDPKMQNVPGGRTGMITAQLKVVRTPEGMKAGYEYSYDATLARELRELHKQASIELAQWNAKDLDDAQPPSKIEYGWVDPPPEDAAPAPVKTVVAGKIGSVVQ